MHHRHYVYDALLYDQPSRSQLSTWRVIHEVKPKIFISELYEEKQLCSLAMRTPTVPDDFWLQHVVVCIYSVVVPVIEAE